MPEPAFHAVDRLRVPPHSIQAEQSVLGGLMLDNASLDLVAARVVKTDFYRREHQLIFQAIGSLADRSQPFDVVTLAEELERRGELNAAGGLAYVGALASDTPSATNISAYAAIVQNHARLRRLIHVTQAINDLAFRPDGRLVSELLNEAERLILAATRDKVKDGSVFTSMKSALTSALDRIETLHERDDPMTGIPTGFTDLDELTAGFQPGDLIIVAGRPGMGKTALAMNIVENVAIRTKRPVAVFSLEMPEEQLTFRHMASLGRIDLHRIRAGRLEDDEWPKLTLAVSQLSEARIFTDDRGALTAGDIATACRRLKREQDDLALVMVDYLQLMRSPADRENRNLELGAITGSLKALAKELDVPVIVLSQLNRAVMSRSDKRPTLADLRDSGSIEQDADLVLMLYRDEVLDPHSEDIGLAELLIRKHRNGPTGVVKLTFLGPYTRFENYTPDRYASGYRNSAQLPSPRSRPKRAVGQDWRGED
jgi:replicative DNA helicase